MPPRIKTGANYVNVRLARFQAKRDGYDDAILMNSAGKVAETPGAAIFVCQERKVVTPDVTSGILESITRDTIIYLARNRNLIVEERPLDRTEIYTADEVFLAGTAAEILPVIEVDGLRVGTGGIGEVTNVLQQSYFDLVEGRTPGPRDWLAFHNAHS
jgi:branched-chain amino acid aminotransferase